MRLFLTCLLLIASFSCWAEDGDKGNGDTYTTQMSESVLLARKAIANAKSLQFASSELNLIYQQYRSRWQARLNTNIKVTPIKDYIYDDSGVKKAAQADKANNAIKISWPYWSETPVTFAQSIVLAIHEAGHLEDLPLDHTEFDEIGMSIVRQQMSEYMGLFNKSPSTDMDRIESYHQYIKLSETVGLDKIEVMTPWQQDLSAEAISRLARELNEHLENIQTSGPFAGFIYPQKIDFKVEEVCTDYTVRNQIMLMNSHVEDHRLKDVNSNRYSYSMLDLDTHFEKSSSGSGASNYNNSYSGHALAQYQSRGLHLLATAAAASQATGSRAYEYAQYMRRDYALRRENAASSHLRTHETHDYLADRQTTDIIPRSFCTKVVLMVSGSATLQILPSRIIEVRGDELIAYALKDLIDKIDQDFVEFVKMAAKLNTQYVLSANEDSDKDMYGPFLPRKTIKLLRQYGTYGKEDDFASRLGHQPSNFENLLNETYARLIQNLAKLKEEWGSIHPLASRIFNSTVERIRPYSKGQYFIVYRYAGFDTEHKMPVVFALPPSFEEAEF